MKKIEARGLFVKVDDDDFKKFGHLTWRTMWSKTTKNYYVISGPGRIGTEYEGRTFYLHREIMGNPKGFDVDHKNHDTLDCRKKNLRICTRSENLRNRKGALGASGVRGVFWNKECGKWQVRIYYNKRYVYGGLFKRKIDAKRRSIELRKEYFGEFWGRP